MITLATLICVVAGALAAYGQARRRGEWSWPGFGLTLLLVLVYAGLSVWAGIGLDASIGAEDPLVRTLCRLAPIALGAVPLAIAAKAVQRRFARRAPNG